MAKALTHQDRLDLFFSRAFPEPNSGCWIWTGEWKNDGYGECWTFGRRETAHRASYRELKGPIPKGLMVRHTCDVRACVNPDHLLIGTQQDNMDDKVARHRQARGLTSGQAKLTEEEVREIRASALAQRTLAKIYNVSQPAIGMIKRRVNWKYLD